MTEQVYKISASDETAVEKVIFDENINYIHMIFNKDDGLPEHFSNSNVYMTVVRGILSAGLGEQDVHTYSKGTVLKIPQGTKMNIRNRHQEVLELIVIKAPAPSRRSKS